MASLSILITGASGFVGSALVRRLGAAGHRVHALARGVRDGRSPWWDPASGRIELAPCGPLDAVIHLAGESIAGGRWTAARKVRIRESRVQGTSVLARALLQLNPRPAVLIAASAIGFYGDRGDALVDEDSPPGTGFLADVCRQWEGAADAAATAGMRVVRLRLGLVLDRSGGALPRMLPAFRFGLGGMLGGGRQVMSWVMLDDLLAMVEHALCDARLSGPVNAVAPGAVTNGEFTRALGRVLHRPACMRVPAPVVRALFGEMGEALLLAGARVDPKRLRDSGYPFRHPALEPALRELLRP